MEEKIEIKENKMKQYGGYKKAVIKAQLVSKMLWVICASTGIDWMANADFDKNSPDGFIEAFREATCFDADRLFLSLMSAIETVN